MRVFGRELFARREPATLSPAASGRGWFPVIRESYTGAWQQNVEISAASVLANPTVFACVTLIASDISKCRLRLVQQTNGIWTEAQSPAFSPVLRKPNRAQTIIRFLEAWMLSKLIHGNTFVLKQRDDRGVVTSLYVLDPQRVIPLVAPDGAVYYRLSSDALAGLEEEAADVTVPAREIIHDRFNCLFHQLIGISPLYAAGGPAALGLKIQDGSTRFFANNSRPSGILTAPGNISNEQAAEYKTRWQGTYGAGAETQGGVAVLGAGLEYKPLTMTAVDAQLIEQDKRTAELTCSAYHVPAALVDASHAPPYANSEPLMQQYYSQCLQAHMTSLETSLDEGLELPREYGTEFDIDDLIWMDTATRTKAAADAIGAAVMSPNEARKKYFGLGPIPGGDSAYLQVQNYSLEALAKRDAETPAPGTNTGPQPTPPDPAPGGNGDEENGEDDDEDEDGDEGAA